MTVDFNLNPNLHRQERRRVENSDVTELQDASFDLDTGELGTGYLRLMAQDSSGFMQWTCESLGLHGSGFRVDGLGSQIHVISAHHFLCCCQ